MIDRKISRRLPASRFTVIIIPVDRGSVDRTLAIGGIKNGRILFEKSLIHGELSKLIILIAVTK